MAQNIDFSIILPTRDRPRLLGALFKSLGETTQNPKKVEIILYIDPDDLESQRVPIPVNFNIKRLLLPNDTMGNITRRCFEESVGKYIVLLNDDVLVRTKSWDSIVLNAFSGFPDEIVMVYPNDLYYGKQICCFPILTRKVATLIGNIVPPQYGKHSIDSHIFDIFYKLEKKGFRRGVYLRNVIFEHMNLGIMPGLDSNQVATSRNREDRELFCQFDQFREGVANKLFAEISSFNSNKSAGLSRDKITLFYILKEGTLLNTSNNLEVIARHTSLIPCLDAIVLVGRPVLIKYINIPKILKKMIVKSPAMTTEMVVESIFNYSNKIQSKWIGFLEGSSEISEGWPLSSLQYITKNKNVSIISPMWLNPRSGNIEQAGLAIFKSRSGIEVSQLYNGCNPDEIPRGKPRDVQVVGFSGLIINRQDYINTGGMGLVTQSGYDLAGLCVGIGKLGKRIIYNPNATIYHSTGSVIVRESLLKWEKDLKYDLEEVLKKDQFLLHKTENSLYIFPSPELIDRYKENKDYIGLKTLLSRTLGIARTFKASKEDIEYLERELCMLNIENSTLRQSYAHGQKAGPGLQSEFQGGI